MITRVFDLETNGLLYPFDGNKKGDAPPTVATRIHCMTVIDCDTGAEKLFVNSLYNVKRTDGTLEEGLKYLEEADLIVGHRIQEYDLQILAKLMRWKPRAGQRHLDTMIATRCIWPDIKRDDYAAACAPSGMSQNRANKVALKAPPSKQLRGAHTLEAWGHRLGIFKGNYGKGRSDWSTYDEEMGDYCVQDGRVNVALYKAILAEDPSAEMLQLEHDFAVAIQEQYAAGVGFDVVAAEQLTAELQVKRAVESEALKDLFPPRVIDYVTPVKKIPKQKTIVFNPGSRQQIAWNLMHKYDWKPVDFTDSGEVCVDAEVMEELPYPEAKQLLRFLELQKRLGQISEGDNGWLKLVTSAGRIHGGVVTNGTVTSRCTHVRPNLGQVPRVDSPYGHECRALFIPHIGWVLIGCDASGCQLRMLANYMAGYDGGAYVKVVTEGDPHQLNADILKITRAIAKTWIYAYLFGAQPRKLSTITGRTEAIERRMMNRFYDALPALRQLKADLKETVRVRGYLLGLDGRRLPIRAQHLALNVLLMAGEAVAVKKATTIVRANLEAAGIRRGLDYNQVLHVHDEYQFEAKPEFAAKIGEVAQEAIRAAGVHFRLRCPLDGQHSSGPNWAATH